MAEILRLDGVGFVRNGRRILADIDLMVRAGDHWALLGPNGAGKSTILSMCGAEQHPTTGTVEVHGQRLGRVEIRKLRESIGHVNPRHPLRSPLTVRQVVLTGATGTVELMNRWEPDDALIARVDDAIDLLGLRRVENALWPTMSQGERGRTLIARALVTDPPLLLLDEPSTGLDVAAREQFLETLDRLHASKPDLATVLVTHHLEELPETTTHAMLIARGRVLAGGPAHEVLTTDLVTEAFEHPIDIEYRDQRWQARARRTAPQAHAPAGP
ncbi:MAG: ABC transporter ATP-binding protein [Pseudoclavibacter sp.]